MSVKRPFKERVRILRSSAYCNNWEHTAWVMPYTEDGTVNDGRAERVRSAKGRANDLCIESVRMRLDRHDVAGLRSAVAIARLLGQDEVVAQMEEDGRDAVRRRVSGSNSMLSGDEINAMLRLAR